MYLFVRLHRCVLARCPQLILYIFFKAPARRGTTGIVDFESLDSAKALYTACNSSSQPEIGGRSIRASYGRQPSAKSVDIPPPERVSELLVLRYHTSTISPKAVQEQITQRYPTVAITTSQCVFTQLTITVLNCL